MYINIKEKLNENIGGNCQLLPYMFHNYFIEKQQLYKAPSLHQHPPPPYKNKSYWMHIL